MVNPQQENVVALAGGGAGQQSLPIKYRGRPIPSRDRDCVIGEIAKRGVEEVVADICALGPSHTRITAMALLRGLEKDPDHRFLSTARNIVAALARKYRNELPFDARPGAMTVQQPLQPASGMTTETVAQVVVSVIQQLGLVPHKQPQAPALPPAQAPTDFSKMTEMELREILNAHHTALARDLEASGVRGGFNAAWRLSYRAFQEQTGIDVLGPAKRENVRAIEVIARLGELRRFWDVVRSVRPR